MTAFDATKSDWTVSMIMELQKSCGVHDAKLDHLSSDLNHLRSDVDEIKKEMGESRKAVGRLERIVFAAIVVMTLAATVLGWMINAAKDVVLPTRAQPQAESPAKSP
jgi:hypothetical protein